jgi:hypothetical protein
MLLTHQDPQLKRKIRQNGDQKRQQAKTAKAVVSLIKYLVKVQQMGLEKMISVKRKKSQTMWCKLMKLATISLPTR